MKLRIDTFCKSCRKQASMDYASTKGRSRIIKRANMHYDAIRIKKYIDKKPMDIARTMVVIVETVKNGAIMTIINSLNLRG